MTYEIAYHTFLSLMGGALPIIVGLIVYLGKRYHSNNLVRYFYSKNKPFIIGFTIFGGLIFLANFANCQLVTVHWAFVIYEIAILLGCLHIVRTIFTFYMAEFLIDNLIKDIFTYICENPQKNEDELNIAILSLEDMTIDAIHQYDTHTYHIVHQKFINKFIHYYWADTSNKKLPMSFQNFLVKVNTAFCLRRNDDPNFDFNIMAVVIPGSSSFFCITEEYCSLIWKLLQNFIDFNREDLIWQFWQMLDQYANSFNTETNHSSDCIIQLNHLFCAKLHNVKKYEQLLYRMKKTYSKQIFCPSAWREVKDYVNNIIADETNILRYYKFESFYTDEETIRVTRESLRSYYEWYNK